VIPVFLVSIPREVKTSNVDWPCTFRCRRIKKSGPKCWKYLPFL